MPKYTVYGSDVTFYQATVEAPSVEALHKMDTEEFDWVEYDGEGIEITIVELDGKIVTESVA